MGTGLTSKRNHTQKHKKEHQELVHKWYEKNKEKIAEASKTRRKERRPVGTTTCKILKNHYLKLKDDPERLTTEFLQSLIGIKCKKRIE